ncbi:glycosyltransferase [Dechloromonas sp. ARDL1]|uniref:glycosyltransferase n=1 Tax=Dechloromonas sp. ARDL1 TaxID=3322121 RepID=UPI003DA7586C
MFCRRCHAFAAQKTHWRALLRSWQQATCRYTSAGSGRRHCYGLCRRPDATARQDACIGCPLRYGAGIKGKIGTAMAVGLPVVATSLAAEGMSLTDGENILVADDAEALAAAIARIYQDEALWNRISENGVDFAEQSWGAEAAWNKLARILCELGFLLQRGNRQLILYGADRSDGKKLRRQILSRQP